MDTTSTVSLPTLDELIDQHGIEDDVFLYYLFKLKENTSVYEVTLRYNASIEPQNNDYLIIFWHWTIEQW